jgi:predicted dehydrogenase
LPLRFALAQSDAREWRVSEHAVCNQPIARAVGPSAINYTKDLIADGYVGRVLSATMIGCAPNWGPSIDRAYQADFANGANLLTSTGGHTIDALCCCLGEFRELAAFVVSQRDRIPVEESGELIAKTSPDQLVVNGIVEDGTVVSFQIRGGMNRGMAFLFEIHGDQGDLQLTATSRASMQRQELNVRGARERIKANT